MSEIDLSGLDLDRWPACERWAVHGSPRGGGGGRGWRTDAAVVVAEGALAELMGEDPVAIEDRGSVRLDTQTRRIDDIGRQAAMIASEAAAILDDAGYRVDEDAPEPPGRHRMSLAVRGELFSGDAPPALVRLRTGQTLGGVWLSLARELDADPDRPDTAGVLHVPRQRLGREVVGALHWRETADLLDEWRPWAAHIERALTDRGTLARPGPHCERCRLVCAVRAAGEATTYRREVA